MKFESLTLARKKEIALMEYTKAEIEAMTLSALNEVVQEQLYCFEELAIQRKTVKMKQPENMTLYDNDKTIDRYTLVVEKDGTKYFYGLSENGFNQFLGASCHGYREAEHLGTIIALEDVSEIVQKAILNRIETLENEEQDNRFKKFAYHD